jgi:hypothetical protein
MGEIVLVLSRRAAARRGDMTEHDDVVDRIEGMFHI